MMQEGLIMTPYIWQTPDWPNFQLNYDALSIPLGRCRHLQGQLFQQIRALGMELERNTQLEALTQEAVQTAAIEGERLNADSVRSSIAKRLGLPSAGLPQPRRDVDGLVDVLLDATDNNPQPLTTERLKGWHAALFPSGYSGLYKIRVADWRETQMQIISGPAGREKVHYEAPPAEKIEQEMQKLLTWWQDTVPTKAVIDPVVRAGIAHYWFVAIHPFDDGNGRIARALTDMALAQADGATKRCYSMSATIIENRNSYYQVLEQTSKGTGNLSTWMLWFLDCYEKSMLHTQKTMEKVLGISRFWQHVAPLAMNERQRKVVRKLLETGEGGFTGGLTAKKYLAMTKTSRATGTRDLADLVAKGILLSEGERAGTRYELNWELAKKG
jgi:Fic family protein